MRKFLFAAAIVAAAFSFPHDARAQTQTIIGPSQLPTPNSTATASDILVGTHVGQGTVQFSIASIFAAAVKQQGPVFNVHDYGATGNGTTDDSPAIYQAISAAATAGGGEVWLPCFGRYYANTAQALAFTSAANIVVAGCGSSSEVIVGSGTTAPLFQFTNANNITFRSFEIQGANSNTTSNPAYAAIATVGSTLTRLENMTGYYLNGPMLKQTANATNYSFITYLSNIEDRQGSGGLISVDNSAYAPGQPCESASVFINAALYDTSVGNGDAYYFRCAHDIFLNQVGDSYQSNSGVAIHGVGDVGPFMINEFDGGGGTGSGSSNAALEFDSDSTGSPARIMLTNSIIEYSTSGPGIVMNAGQQFQYTNNVFEFINGSTTYPCVICIASGVTAVQFVNNTMSGNGGSSPFYTIQNASSGTVDFSHNTVADTSDTAWLNNTASSNLMTSEDNSFYGTNTYYVGAKPNWNRGNKFPSASGTIAQDWNADNKGNTTQTGYFSTTANAATPPPNVQGMGVSWNPTGTGDAGYFDQYYVSGSGTNAAHSFYVATSATTYTLEDFFDRQGDLTALGNVTANGGTGFTAGSSTYGPAGASVAGVVSSTKCMQPGNGSAVGTALVCSGTGVPTFSAPNASSYQRYDGATGSRLYYNTSGASTSGTTWTAISGI